MQVRASNEARFIDPLCQKQMPKRKKWNLWNRTGGYSRLCMAGLEKSTLQQRARVGRGEGERHAQALEEVTLQLPGQCDPAHCLP
jgi:hypothetical protein